MRHPFLNTNISSSLIVSLKIGSSNPPAKSRTSFNVDLYENSPGFLTLPKTSTLDSTAEIGIILTESPLFRFID